MLNLQGVLPGKIEIIEEKQQIVVPCRSARRVAICPVCGMNTKKVHQTKLRKIKHGMLNYRQVILRLTVRRFQCRHCRKVFTKMFPRISRDRSSANLKIQPPQKITKSNLVRLFYQIRTYFQNR